MKFSISNKLNSEALKVSEITMNDMRDISFMIESESDDALNDFLMSKLEGDGNCVTKFIALFKAREHYIGETISLNNGSNNIVVQLYYWFDEIINHTFNIKNDIVIDKFKISIDYPSNLLHSDYTDLLIDMIKCIQVDDNKLQFNTLIKSEKELIIQNLPYNVIKKIHEHIDNTQYEISLFQERLGIPDIDMSFFNNSAFNIIKLLFNYYKYDDIIETVFMMSNRISDVGFLMSRTPKDVSLLIKLYREEVEKSNSEDKSL